MANMKEIMQQAVRKSERKERKKAILGLYLNTNWIFSYNGFTDFVLTSVRGIGKTVIGMEIIIQLIRKYGAENVKAYYFRINDNSIKALLKPDKAVDPYLIDKYDMDITIKGNKVFNHGKPLYEAYPLVSAASIGKGVNLYDCNYFNGCHQGGKKKFIVTIWDEFMQDDGVGRKSVGDPVKQYRIYKEALLRDQEVLDYNAVYNILLANNVSECANVTGQLYNYIPNPNNYKRVKLTRKRTVFWNVEVTKAYKEKRAKSYNANMMDYNDDPNYAKVERDLSMIKPKKTQIHKVTQLIMFSKQKSDWFCIYDGKYIRKYHGETVNKNRIVTMRRHNDKVFNPELVQNIFDLYDSMCYIYCDIISMASFQARMRELKAK